MQRGEPQMSLLLGAAGRQHGQATAAGVGSGGVEQCALAHARVADDDQRLPAPGDAVEHPADIAQLLVAPDKRRLLCVVCAQLRRPGRRKALDSAVHETT